MSTSADLVQIAISAEDVYGVTNANPAFLVIRTTGEGLAFAPTTTKSNEMNPARQVTDSILTGGSVTGDLNFEMAHEEWFDALLAGAFCADWATNLLKVGSVLKSFTVEKMIPVPGGITQYHRYAGCTVNGFTFDVKPNQAITGSFSMLGKGVEIGEAPLAGATYTYPFLTPVMTAPRVVGIEIGGIPAVSQCFNNLQISMNNNNRAIECIGTLGAKELALGRLETTATFGVLFSDSSLLQALLDQTETSLGFTTTDSLAVGSPAANNSFQWVLPRVKFSANPVVAGGTGQDVVNAVVAEGLLDTVSGSAIEVTRSALIHGVSNPGGGGGGGGGGGSGDTRPRVGVGSATAGVVDPAALLASMTAVGTNGSKVVGSGGTGASVAPGAGQYGWMAFKADISASGVTFTDSLGTGGWAGASSPGNNGADDGGSPNTSSVTFNDGTNNWRFFRQSYAGAADTFSTS